MTNRERLNRMNTDDYARETAAFAACPVRQFVDYETWLESSDPEYPIMGEDGLYDSGKRQEPCKIVGRFERFGKSMARIILSRKALHDFELLTVDAAKVELVIAVSNGAPEGQAEEMAEHGQESMGAAASEA